MKGRKAPDRPSPDHPSVARVRAWLDGLFVTRTEEVYQDMLPESRGRGAREGPDGTLDKDGWRRFVRGFLAAFPDVEIFHEDALGDGETVFNRSRFEMTHLGSFLGLPATGRRVAVDSIACSRLQGSRTVGGFTHWDLAGALAQMGVLVLPPGAGMSELAPALEPAGAPVPRARESDPVLRIRAFSDRLFNGRDESVIPELMGPKARIHRARGGEAHGTDRDGWRDFVRGLVAAIPDLDLRVVQALGDERLVFWRWEAQGTHLGTLPGRGATGRRVRFEGQGQVRLGRGRITDLWFVWDLAGLLAQTGVLPVGGERVADLGEDLPPVSGHGTAGSGGDGG